jgi:prolyl 4-hydroxylase
MYSADPILYEVKNFLSPKECDAFIEAGKSKLKPSKVITTEKGKSTFHPSRVSQNCFLAHDTNESINEVSKRISILVQTSIRNAESYQLVHYEVGGEYKPHFDGFNYEKEKEWFESGGQRIITVIAYLNDVEEGGGTSFPKIGHNISAKQGNVVVFHNSLPSQDSPYPKIHPKSLHGGMPVIKGEKWMVNLWFRENIID